MLEGFQIIIQNIAGPKLFTVHVNQTNGKLRKKTGGVKQKCGGNGPPRPPFRIATGVRRPVARVVIYCGSRSKIEAIVG